MWHDSDITICSLSTHLSKIPGRIVLIPDHVSVNNYRLVGPKQFIRVLKIDEHKQLRF